MLSLWKRLPPLPKMGKLPPKGNCGTSCRVNMSEERGPGSMTPPAQMPILMPLPSRPKFAKYDVSVRSKPANLAMLRTSSWRASTMSPLPPKSPQLSSVPLLASTLM